MRRGIARADVGSAGPGSGRRRPISARHAADPTRDRGALRRGFAAGPAGADRLRRVSHPWISNFDDAAHDNHGLREYELVGYGRINFDGAQEIYFRGRTDYDNYNSGDSFDRQPDHLEGRVEEGWYRFDLQRYLSVYQGRTIQNDLSVKAGRQFVDWGNGLTLDQYVDGIAAEIRGQHLSLDLLACVTVKETIDFDITRPDFDANTRRGYYGHG